MLGPFQRWMPVISYFSGLSSLPSEAKNELIDIHRARKDKGNGPSDKSLILAMHRTVKKDFS
jgi:hypothetical protein